MKILYTKRTHIKLSPSISIYTNGYKKFVLNVKFIYLSIFFISNIEYRKGISSQPTTVNEIFLIPTVWVSKNIYNKNFAVFYFLNKSFRIG